jgi:hypothetical protein
MNRADRRRAERAGKTTDPLAITWFSNAMWTNTGYGTQTAQAVPRIAADGHKPAVLAMYGLEATRLVYEGIPHFPQGYAPYSNDVIEPTFREWSRGNADLTPLVLALFDAWPLKGPAWDRMPVGIWTMIDHLPAPPAVLDFLRKPNVLPLAASMFAHEQIARADIESLYVPMAIDTTVYKPTATWTRDDGVDVTGRQLMGFDEDVFVVSLVNANKAAGGVHRKSWHENLMAFSIFAEGKDDVRAYIHTEKAGVHSGHDLEKYLRFLDVPKDKYRFVNQWALFSGIPSDAMAALFTATDVLLASTMGEGFGLTVAEAGACETPVIVSDFTCQPELISADSYAVSGQPFYDVAQEAMWMTPNIGEIVGALEAAYTCGRYRSAAQRQHIVDNYDADLVFRQHWRPALARLGEHARQVLNPSAAVEPLPVTTPATDARLTIYVPTYKRPTLAALLASLAPQLTEQVEVVISDNDPDKSALTAVQRYVPDATYINHGTNIGGEANLLRGWESGSAPWVWMIGDDDEVLPGAVADVLAAIEHDDVDRLILLTREAPSGAAGMIGSPQDLEHSQPGLTIAATLISANVVRRSSLDLTAGRAHVGTMYGWAWAMTTCRRVKVLASPAIKVGADHAGDFLAQAGYAGDIGAVWTDLLLGFGVNPHDGAFSWNFASAA